MPQDEILGTEKTSNKNKYHSFLNQRLPEIKQNNPNISSQDAYQIVRKEWSQKKETSSLIKKPRGRPKKTDENIDNYSVSSGNSNTSNVKRGRPPKNPLVSHVSNFEKYLQWCQNSTLTGDFDTDFQNGQDELGIDQETFQLFKKHSEPNSELHQLLKKKNSPKKNRGRPKGSKNKSTKETDEIGIHKIDTPPEVIQFNQDLDSIFNRIDNM